MSDNVAKGIGAVGLLAGGYALVKILKGEALTLPLIGEGGEYGDILNNGIETEEKQSFGETLKEAGTFTPFTGFKEGETGGIINELSLQPLGYFASGMGSEYRYNINPSTDKGVFILETEKRYSIRTEEEIMQAYEEHGHENIAATGGVHDTKEAAREAALAATGSSAVKKMGDKWISAKAYTKAEANILG